MVVKLQDLPKLRRYKNNVFFSVTEECWLSLVYTIKVSVITVGILHLGKL